MLSPAGKKGTPEYKAKKWGNAHGYEGREGGWIYSKRTGKPVVQGWWRFYQRYQSQIEAEGRCQQPIEYPNGIGLCRTVLVDGACPNAKQHMGAK